MRAAVIDRPGTISIVDAIAPEPGPGQVQVRLHGSGVCGSNLPVWEGRPWFNYPLPPGAPGHEGWGRIERLGDGVEHLSVGDAVAVLSQRAFAELDIAQANQVVPIAASLAASPFPGEAIACGVNVMRRAYVTAGQRVAIVGVGFLGAVLVRLCALAGAQVTALSRRKFALDIAESLGAMNQVVLDETWTTINEAKAVNGNQEFDIVFEVTGLQTPLDIASQLTATRGRLVIAGYHQDGPRQVDMQMWNWRGIDVINAHERDAQVYVDGMREAARLVESGMLPLDQLVTHVFPIEAAADAFKCAVERPAGFLKAAVVTHVA
jgi:2-desacetyl-2-hydroxyethyl bacteriochlorophyllide A dehydrogenase